MPRKRTARNSLLAIIDEAASPAYLLDDSNEIIYTNAALASWIGQTLESLEGVVCQSASVPLDEPLANATRGLARIADGHNGFRQQVFSTAVKETWQQRGAWFQPLQVNSSGKEGSSVSERFWLVLVDPVEGDEDDDSLDLRMQLAKQVQMQFPDRPPWITFGTSTEAQQLRRQIEIAVRSQAQVVIIGPRGCGAESVARHIFRQAQGDSRLECLTPISGSIADQAMIQEVMRRIARSTSAGDARTSQWVLLLDADKLEPSAQMELGGFLNLPNAQIRMLATSQTRLVGAGQGGGVARELAARVSELEILLEPLARRLEDLPMILQQAIETTALNLGFPIPRVAEATREWLLEYRWPGNVTELAEVVAEALRSLYSYSEDNVRQSRELKPEHFPERIRIAIRHGRLERKPATEVDLGERLAEIEREYIERALQECRFNRSAAAKLLKMNRARLLRRCEQLAIVFPDQEIEFLPADEAIEFMEEDE